MSPPFVAQDLAHDARRFSLEPDLQAVRHQALPSRDRHAILHLDGKVLPVGSARDHLVKPAPSPKGSGNVERQAIPEEAEHVEEGALPGAVRPDHHAKPRNVRHLRVLVGFEVSQANLLDLDHRIPPVPFARAPQSLEPAPCSPTSVLLSSILQGRSVSLTLPLGEVL